MRSTTKTRAVVIALCGVLSGLSAAGRAAAQSIAAHPDELEFPALDFTPPVATEFRTELPSGVPVYLIPSQEFPLITLTFTFKGGVFLEEPDEAGLGAALGSQMRRGGTTSIGAEELDERLDFLAANVSSFVGADSSGATMNCLTRNFDECFALFMDMVRNPGFDAERLRVHQDQVIEQLKQRNDNPMSVAMMSMSDLLFGPEHFSGRQPTQASIQSITPERLRALHAKIFHPDNLIIAATGDFESAELLSKLNAALAGWPGGPKAGNPPAPTKKLVPGLYHADTAQEDLPQGTAILVTRSIRRDDPDLIPMQVMNHVLGGGGFSSRITNRVRSDEGLAYTAMTFLQPEVYYPGIHAAFFQSKNRTVALATEIILDEIDRMSTEEITEEELEQAKASFIEEFPQRFASKASRLGTFVSDELTGRDPEFWQTFREKVNAVTRADVLRVAREHLDPDQMAILVVGDWEEIYGGDLEGRATMNDFFGGNVTHMPMRDPLTLEPKR